MPGEDDHVGQRRADEQDQFPPVVRAGHDHEDIKRGRNQGDQGCRRRLGHIGRHVVDLDAQPGTGRSTRVDQHECDKGDQPDDDPVGHGMGEDALDEAAPRPLVVRCERQHERGHTDGEPRRDRDVDRLERVGERREAENLARHAGNPDEQCQQNRIHGLGEKQIRHALDIADDPPPLADDVGKRGELVVEQHDLRHRSCRRTARAHRHPDIGILEGQHVVYPVPGHRDGVVTRLQRFNHCALLVGADTPEYGAVRYHLGQFVGVLRKRSAVNGIVDRPESE